MIETATITRNWPLTGVRLYEAFGGYPSRKVFALDADQGSFVVKVDRTRWRADSACRLQVLDYLADREFPHAPKLLHTRSGARALQTENETMTVLERIPRRLDEDETTWDSVGRAAALLNAQADYPHEYPIRTDLAIAELVDRVVGRPFERDYIWFLQRVAHLSQPGTPGLIHGEINTANTAIRADGTVVFLDWDAAGTGSTFIEYGYPLITVFVRTSPLGFDRSRAGAFYTGYRDAGGQIDVAKAFASGLFHALRYLWPPSMNDAEIDRRWRRVLYAVDREGELCSVLT